LGKPQLVELLWTSDQPNAETSTGQHTTITRQKYPCPLAGFEIATPTSELLADPGLRLRSGLNVTQVFMCCVILARDYLAKVVN